MRRPIGQQLNEVRGDQIDAERFIPSDALRLHVIKANEEDQEHETHRLQVTKIN
jgi:hypothetical protein